MADLLDILAILVAVSLVVLVAVDRGGTLRMLLTVAFTLFVPGRAIVTNWPWLARWSAAVMSMILSLGVLSLLAAVTLWARNWQPAHLFLAEAIASLIGLMSGVGMRRLRLQGRPPTTPVLDIEALAVLVGLASGAARRGQQPDGNLATEAEAPTRPDMLLPLSRPTAR